MVLKFQYHIVPTFTYMSLSDFWWELLAIHFSLSDPELDLQWQGRSPCFTDSSGDFGYIPAEESLAGRKKSLLWANVFDICNYVNLGKLHTIVITHPLFRLMLRLHVGASPAMFGRLSYRILQVSNGVLWGLQCAFQDISSSIRNNWYHNTPPVLLIVLGPFTHLTHLHATYRVTTLHRNFMSCWMMLQRKCIKKQHKNSSLSFVLCLVFK